MDNQKNNELILRAMKGDSTAFDELYRQYEKVVYFIALKMCSSEADAKDVLQETFIQVHKSIHKLNHPDYFKLWLQKITISKCKNLFRKNQNYKFSFDYDDVDIQNRLIEHHQDFVPYKNMNFKSDQEMINYFIKKLPPGQKEVLIMKYFQQLSIQEISEILEIPSGTVKSRISLGKKTLKSYIQDYEKTNDIRISFQSISIEALIASALISDYEALQITSASTILSVFASRFSSSFYTSLGKIVLLVFIAAFTIIGANAVGNHFDPFPFTSPAQKQTGAEGNHNDAEQVEFGPVIVQRVAYTEARTAYQKLKEWAHCSVEMQNISLDQFHEMLPLMKELEKYKGEYYELLKNEGWIDSFYNFFNQRKN